MQKIQTNNFIIVEQQKLFSSALIGKKTMIVQSTKKKLSLILIVASTLLLVFMIISPSKENNSIEFKVRLDTSILMIIYFSTSVIISALGYYGNNLKPEIAVSQKKNSKKKIFDSCILL